MIRDLLGLPLLCVAEGLEAGRYEITASLVVDLQVQRIVGYQREHHSIHKDAVATKHTSRADRPEGFQQVEHMGYELVGRGAHGRV